MFLFFSKLLPLFIYPVGLITILLLLALLLLWKRPKIAAACIASALILLLVSGNAAVAGQLVRSLETQYVPTGALPKAEAIVVLGGGIKPQFPPRPWIDVAEAGDRSIYGAQLYLQGKAPLVILSGGRIEWQGGGEPESSDMAKLVQALGVPRTAIAEDPTSLNTYENAVNVRKILQTRQINRVLLVTSAMHMPRAIQIFWKIGIEAIPAPTDFIMTQANPQGDSSLQATMLTLLPEASYLQQFTLALKEYLGWIIYWLKGWL
ncbi:MAG TPA: YdcF family protein [Trichocoleus sp.]|jgi:uncharacterized SAM-binding protein YcdF (DUF218 family)